MVYDVIIIGKGPAGIQAAIYLQRANKKVIVIGKDAGALGRADVIDNYYGIEHPIDGKSLIELGVRHAQSFGTEVLTDEVINIEKNDFFDVKTINGLYQAKTVLLATGKSRVTMKVKGFDRYRGKGISFCAICDGYIFRKKPLGLIGHNEFMLQELEELKHFTDDITLFTNGQTLVSEVSGVKINTEVIEEFVGEDVITGIKTASGITPLSAVFAAIGTPSASDFALRMGVIMNNNNIEVGPDFMTNIDGLFAAGDCIGGLLQIAKVVSDAAHAAMSITKYLKTLK